MALIELNGGYMINRSLSTDTSSGEAKAICSTYGELASHTPNGDDGDCATAITCSVCGAETTTAQSEHNDGDLNGKCDACGSDMPTEPGTDEPGTEAPELNDIRESEKGTFAEFMSKLGAVAGGFVAFSTAVIAIGFGIFALVWFVVRKKTWAEFISLLKKK